MATGFWFLAFFWFWSLPLVLIVADGEQQTDGCSANSCGNLTISYPFWLPDRGARKSCGPFDFEVSCFNDTPILRSSGSNVFAIIGISYKEHKLRIVDVHREEDSKSCHFPRWNTSAKLAPPFKVNPANLKLMFYNCTETLAHQDRALVEISCGYGSNVFVRAGVRYDEMASYNGYALEGCFATIVPVMSPSGEANASDSEQLISDGFLLTWDSPPRQ